MIQSKYVQSKIIKYTLLLAIGLFVSLLSSIGFSNTVAHGANVNNFKAGNIIGNTVFRNNGSMTTSQIQNFLNQKNSVCLKNYRAPSLIDANGNGQVEDWTSAERYGGPDGKQTMSAAELIKAASDIYKINPQVLLVTLQKEQGLITRSDCPDWRYRTAFGYGCPDTAACDSAAFGFTTQIDNAAYHFKGYYQNSITYVPFTKGTYRIGYNPDSRCGNTQVNIENEATGALYSYTPYQPNTYAKNGGIDSTFPNCGAFGNLNFWKFFTDWFGSTQYTVKGAIGEKYNTLGGASGALGDIVSNEKCGLKSSGCYQIFSNGAIYWTSSTGARVIKGGIGSKWGHLGYERGRLGYPIKDEVCGLKEGGCFQQFQYGKIYWTQSTDSQPIWGGIEQKWDSIDYERSVVGYPTSQEKCGLAGGGCYQVFQGGSIYWTEATGPHFIKAGIRDRWASLGYERSALGYPKTDEICGIKDGGCYQLFQKGRIYWTDRTGPQAMWGAIRDKYMQSGNEWGKLGYPTSGEIYTSSHTYQKFEGGTIYWTTKRGAWVEVNLS